LDAEGPTDGVSPLLPLVHRCRVDALDAPHTTLPRQIAPAPPNTNIESDTQELDWHTSGARTGHLTIDTPRLQAAVGWIGSASLSTKDVDFTIQTPFCAVSLTALDGKPLARSERILLVAAGKCWNTGMTWNTSHTSLTSWGGPPERIEIVHGRVTLHRDRDAPALAIASLDGSGIPIGSARAADEHAGQTESFDLSGESGSPWYILSSSSTKQAAKIETTLDMREVK
jgi:hypothetical protein